jgi:hypothetical protein
LKLEGRDVAAAFAAAASFAVNNVLGNLAGHAEEDFGGGTVPIRSATCASAGTVPRQDMAIAAATPIKLNRSGQAVMI